MKKQYQYIGREYTMVRIEADDQEKSKVVNGEIIESSREDEKYFTRNGFVLLGDDNTEVFSEEEVVEETTETSEEVTEEIQTEEEVVEETTETSKNTPKKSK
jgi:hypothetical protein